MRSAKLRLLMIEDNSGDAKSIQKMLIEVCPNKYEIVCADNMSVAKGLLKENIYDVVLTDLNLINSEAIEEIEQIQEIKPAIPIIVLSGEDSEELAMRVAQAGAQDYLVKGQGDGHLIHRAIHYAIERKKIERGLSFLAKYDSLTGLANRALFRERLSRAIARADRCENLMALIFIDLDRFKNVNDTLGHDTGDQLLVEVGGRLKNCLRESDTVGRLGGDEFIILLEDIEHIDAAAHVAEKVLDIMNAPIHLEGHDVFVTPSIGITIYPLDGETDESLLRNADTAMYRAKDKGRNGFQFYTADMNSKAVNRLQLESRMRVALKKEEFVLYYQPKYNLHSEMIIGAEALIRWNDPESGMISPADFIPLSEETGLIVPMGNWVIKAACQQTAQWQIAGFTDIRVAVNLSARQFRETDVVNILMDEINSAGISPYNIEVEMTESMLMDDTERSNAVLKELKGHGIKISIDDFGTGYSSLSYLKRFKIDTLKIDQSFVRDITVDPDGAAIASAIIALGKSLRLNVIAEGVETEQQLKFLRNRGCYEAQGFYFSKPVPAEEFTQLLIDQQPTVTDWNATSKMA